MPQNASPPTLRHEPLVSIVLPSYNGAQFLARSIESCLGQTWKNLELILVDDCSSDDTLSIMQRYADLDSRVTVVHNEHNRHIAASLNRGFALARGDYFSWTSDDNFYDKDAIAAMVAALEENEADVVYADQRIIDNEGKLVSEKIHNAPIDILLCSNIIGACFLYRNTVHARCGGYDEHAPMIEDYKFWVSAWQSGCAFVHLGRTLYDYRLHPGSLTCSRQREIKRLHLDYIWSLHHLYPTVSKRAKYWYCRTLMDLSLLLHGRTLRQFVLFFLRNNPFFLFKSHFPTLGQRVERIAGIFTGEKYL